MSYKTEIDKALDDWGFTFKSLANDYKRFHLSYGIDYASSSYSVALLIRWKFYD